MGRKRKVVRCPLRAVLYGASMSGELQAVQLTSRGDWQVHRDLALYTLGFACFRGHLQMVQWMCETFEITVSDQRKGIMNIVHDIIVEAFHQACTGGKMQVAQWLLETYKLTAADAKSNDNYALRGACEWGHLRMAQWLHRTFGMTREDAESHDGEALERACARDRRAVVQWLCDTYVLPWPRYYPSRSLATIGHFR
jgi:hypothetical protein